MEQTKSKQSNFLLRIIQGALIGLGAVLPGISGGVLCVIFGIYKTIMEFLADPFRKMRTHLPLLIPIGIGGVIGFLGVANVLSFLLEKYPDPSVCLFVGLIGGMLPSLFREAGEQGRNKASYVSMYVAMAAVFALLVGLHLFAVEISPNFLWYVFCGFCLALSVIAPGMSFSTLLMPLGLYEPFVAGIGYLDLVVLIPGGIGGLATVILFAKAVDMLFKRHYSVAFHAIVGVVIAATIMIIPFASFAASVAGFIVNTICVAAGVAAALWLDKFNQKYTGESAA
ncbi:MAG: DUF368 domain-containing protein [Lachnospiraceae bacterium]|nr:DUF368 domain-containing protein [Lachnospiraceae bacterium]